jgi:hypothetical protein
MVNCKLAIYWPGKKERFVYSCDYIKKAHEEMKFRFRKINGSDRVKKDRYYEDFCMEIDNFIKNCKCDADGQ